MTCMYLGFLIQNVWEPASSFDQHDFQCTRARVQLLDNDDECMLLGPLLLDCAGYPVLFWPLFSGKGFNDNQLILATALNPLK